MACERRAAARRHARALAQQTHLCDDALPLLVHRLTVLEDVERGQPVDVELLREVWVRVGLHLDHLERRELLRGPRGDRGHELARPAPRRPEVHEHRPRVLLHLRLPFGLGHLRHAPGTCRRGGYHTPARYHRSHALPNDRGRRMTPHPTRPRRGAMEGGHGGHDAARGGNCRWIEGHPKRGIRPGIGGGAPEGGKCENGAASSRPTGMAIRPHLRSVRFVGVRASAGSCAWTRFVTVCVTASKKSFTKSLS